MKSRNQLNVKILDLILRSSPKNLFFRLQFPIQKIQNLKNDSKITQII